MAPPRKRTTSLGEQLRELRRRIGCDQEALGAQLFVSGRTVSRWENGTRPTAEQGRRVLALCVREAVDLHDALAVALGFELVDDGGDENEDALAATAPAAVAHTQAPADGARLSGDALRAALDALIYKACEEHDVSPRVLRTFGAALLEALKARGVTHEVAMGVITAARE